MHVSNVEVVVVIFFELHWLNSLLVNTCCQWNELTHQLSYNFVITCLFWLILKLRLRLQPLLSFLSCFNFYLLLRVLFAGLDCCNLLDLRSISVLRNT